MFIEKFKLHILVVGLAILLTTILTWPFVLNLGSFFSDHGDYPFNVAQLWYNQDSLITGRIFSPKDYWHGYQFYPQPYSFAFANNALVPSLIFAPMYWISSNIVLAGNFYTFLTFVLSFLAAFYTIRYFLGERGDKGNQGNLGKFLAATVGGFIFTFNANTMVRFPQHLDVLGKYFLPLVFLFAYQFLEKPNLKKAILFFTFFTLNAFTSAYFQIFSLVMLPIVALPFLASHLIKRDWARFAREARRGYLGRLGKFGLVGLIFLPILLYFNLPYLDFSKKEGATRPLEATPFFSARLNDWFAASPDSFLYGGFVKNMEPIREPKDDRGVLNYEEHTLFLGIIPMILFFIGLIKGNWGDKGNMGNEGKWYFLLLLILPFLLTFGPFMGYKEDGFPLPFYFLYKLVPLLEGVRSPSRFEFLMFIPFSLICAYGVLWLMKKRGLPAGRQGIWVIGVIGVILILENATLKNFDNRSKVLADIQTAGRENLGFLKDKGVLHLPIFTTEDADVFGNNSAYINWATQTHEKIVNGNTSYLPPDQLQLLAQLKQGFNEQGIGILSALGVKFLVVHKNMMDGMDSQIFKNMEPLLMKGKVLENSDLLITDLSSYNTKVPLCSFDDLNIQSSKAQDEDFNISWALVVENPKDCFVISPYEGRYKSIGLDINGAEKKVMFKMPLILGPKEKIILSEIAEDLRVE